LRFWRRLGGLLSIAGAGRGTGRIISWRQAIWFLSAVLRAAAGNRTGTSRAEAAEAADTAHTETERIGVALLRLWPPLLLLLLLVLLLVLLLLLLLLLLESV
jgi:hypothetical protein